LIVKFRSVVTTQLTQDDIKQFAFQSIVTHGVDKDTKTNMIVFTNAKSLHWVTEQRVFSGRVKCFGYSEISNLRFYLGNTELGIGKLLTLGGFGVWAFLDFLYIVTGNSKDGNNLKVK
jgi:hypothetical protein